MIRLNDDETEMLAGAAGPAAALSMRVILAAAKIQGAERLVPIASAHVDSCLYHGPSSLDFARALLAGGGRVRVPTTLNVRGLDRSRPDLFTGPAGSTQA
jgi:predicted aconitase